MVCWVKAGETAKNAHPRSQELFIQYGTAGFRTRAERLDHVMYRMGLLAVLRSKVKDGKAIGVMITASHNPECDNGVKLVDPAGEMLELAWEELATQLANVPDTELVPMLEDLEKRFFVPESAPAQVIVGRDTRSSSLSLATAVLNGVAAAGCSHALDVGVVTTPQLHYMVVATNTKGGYGEPSLNGYFTKLSEAFKKFLAGTSGPGRYSPSLLFDGANGVGAQAMQEFVQRLEGVLNVTMFNTGSGVLNLGCGADFVKVSQAPPAGLETIEDTRCVSVDGDADRVIYFYQSQGKFHLLDGDRIATLLAGYLQQLLQEAGLADKIRLGLVQTAYANGNSTRYITETLGVPVACVPTGVKFLHHKALEFDIGVYFEANGHGTIVFSEAAQSLIKASPSAEKLALLMDVINQTVGDAISDMLAVECVLAARGWSAVDWFGQYTDLPNKLSKVSVKDRNLVTTADAERRVVTPAGLQEKIDQAVASVSRGRSFVRPSGTEDVVRVYAEAETKEEADKLAQAVADIVQEMLG